MSVLGSESGVGDDASSVAPSAIDYEALSFQAHDAQNGDNDLPRIFLMGARRSGKSSIQKVVFHKMSPHETLFLEQTTEIRVKDIANNPLIQFQILDFPGSFDFLDSNYQADLDPNKLFAGCGAIVFVIDAQDDPYKEALEYLCRMAKFAHSFNPNISFEVMIHKVDGDSYLSDDHKIDVQRDIHQQLNEEMLDSHVDIHLSFYLTSIYDHSIFEAFSKVVQKLIPQLPFIENLLDSLIASCRIEKAFLFDVVSKIYVGTDSNPVDMQTYELCSDMIDVVVDVSCIYGLPKRKKGRPQTLAIDNQSASVIRLSNGYLLYLREVSRYLVLVCLMRDDSFKTPGILEHNVCVFKKTLTKLFEPHQNGPPPV